MRYHILDFTEFTEWFWWKLNQTRNAEADLAVGKTKLASKEYSVALHSLSSLVNKCPFSENLLVLRGYALVGMREYQTVINTMGYNFSFHPTVS